MPDEPDHLVLSLLREMQVSMQRMEATLDDLLRRVSPFETIRAAASTASRSGSISSAPDGAEVRPPSP
ncbi:MAG: hypothetical protein U1E60_26110 [Reyranellaceae bacterium]